MLIIVIPTLYYYHHQAIIQAFSSSAISGSTNTSANALWRLPSSAAEASSSTSLNLSSTCGDSNYWQRQLRHEQIYGKYMEDIWHSRCVRWSVRAWKSQNLGLCWWSHRNTMHLKSFKASRISRMLPESPPASCLSRYVFFASLFKEGCSLCMFVQFCFSACCPRPVHVHFQAMTATESCHMNYLKSALLRPLPSSAYHTREISLRKMSVLPASQFPQVWTNFRSDLPLCSACKDVKICSSQAWQPQISHATAPESLLQPSPVEVWQQPDTLETRCWTLQPGAVQRLEVAGIYIHLLYVKLRSERPPGCSFLMQSEISSCYSKNCCNIQDGNRWESCKVCLVFQWSTNSWITAKKPSKHQPIAALCPEAPVLPVLLASFFLLSTETAAISTGGPQDVSTWMSEYVQHVYVICIYNMVRLHIKYIYIYHIYLALFSIRSNIHHRSILKWFRSHVTITSIT